MKKQALFSIFFILGISLCWSQTPVKINPTDLYFLALQGNVKEIIDKLNSTQDNQLDSSQLAFKAKYLTRFYIKKENFDFKTKDTALITILKIYHDYWKEVLLKRESIETADSILAKRITLYLMQTDFKQVSIDTVLDNFTKYAKELLNKRGFGIANGKTGGYFDLLVWVKQYEKSYDVILPESKQKVRVIFMDSIVSMGWEEYATFGKYFPGGWASRDALNCVKSTYDLQSENFKISYLKHEGQHFSDYKIYPNLEGIDLEYRAKLVELSYAEISLIELISFFIHNSSRDKGNTHSFANNCVIRDLSKAIFKKDWEDNIEEWRKIPLERIHRESKQLLIQNSLNLKKIGKNVKEFIN